MHRARSVATKLSPLLGPEQFGSWLLQSTKPARSLSITTTRQYNAPVATEPFLNGSSSAYVEEMYNAWLADPKSVHVVSILLPMIWFICTCSDYFFLILILLVQSWDSFFRNSAGGAAPGQAYQSPPSLAPPGKNQVPLSSFAPQLGGLGASMPNQISDKLIDDHLSVQGLIRSYQVRKALKIISTQVFFMMIMIRHVCFEFYQLFCLSTWNVQCKCRVAHCW